VNKVIIYQPKYYKNFSCTGNECRNNCCHHWRIDIDKKTYDKYMGFDGETKEEFIKKLTPMEGGEKGARTVLDSNGNCSFLDEKGLCTIQLRFGHEYLSITCRRYPRVVCIVDGAPERFLELSCEAAAKQILLEKDFMNFEEVEIDMDTNDSLKENDNVYCNHILDPSMYTKNSNGVNIFWKLRVTSMAILQSRKYKIRFRMLVLCMFIREVNDFFATDRDSEVINIAEVYLSRIESDYFKELSITMPYGTPRESDIMIDLLKDMYARRGILFMKTADIALKAYDMQAGNWVLPDGFSENLSKYYEMYFSDKEYIFENYLVHRVLSEGFPFNYKGEADVLSNYIDLLAKLNIIEFLLTGICRSNMKFDKRRVIDCISVFTRSYEHAETKFLKPEELRRQEK